MSPLRSAPVSCFAFFASPNLNLRVKSVGKKCFQNIGNSILEELLWTQRSSGRRGSPICPRSLVQHRSTVPGCPGAPLPMALYRAAFFSRKKGPRRRCAASSEHHSTHALWINVGATNAPALTKLSSPAAASLLLTALRLHNSLPAMILHAQEHAVMFTTCSCLTTACGCKITTLPPCNSTHSGKHNSEAHLHCQLCYSAEKPRTNDPSSAPSCLHKFSGHDAPTALAHARNIKFQVTGIKAHEIGKQQNLWIIVTHTFSFHPAPPTHAESRVLISF